MPLRSPGRLALTATLALVAVLLAACAQSTATSDTATPTPIVGVDRGVSSAAVPLSPPIETIPVLMQENAILPWKPGVLSPGVYAFEVENRGERVHDLTIVRWGGNPLRMAARSGRAFLQNADIVARTDPLAPGEVATVLADLSSGGQFVLLSAEGTDYGDGFVATFDVESSPAGPARQPLPDPDDESTVGVYVVDGAIFVSRDEIASGDVTLNVQNLGPATHDLTVVRWRGDPRALPVDDATGDVTLDVMTVVASVGPLEAGDAATVVFEAVEEMSYVLLSSIPGDYDAGLSVQVDVR